MHLFAVGVLSVQLLASSLIPVYQVAAATAATTQTTETAQSAQSEPKTETTKESTASSSTPAESAPAESEPASEPAAAPTEETVDPAKVQADLLEKIAQFGDTAGTTVTVADKAIKIELSPQLSKKAEEIKKRSLR